MNTCDCVIFDLDGTLLDSKLCSVQATRDAFTKTGLKAPHELLIEHFMGIPIEESFLKMSDKNLNKQQLTELIETFREYYRQYEEISLKTFPGISQVLEILNKNQIPCFVVSSKKTEVVNRNLAAQGLVDYFLEVIGSDKVSKYKPNPEGIYKVLEQHQLDPRNTIMVGDAVFDIQMGKSAGVQTIAVTWGSHNVEMLESENPNILVDKPQDILRYIGL